MRGKKIINADNTVTSCLGKIKDTTLIEGSLAKDKRIKAAQQQQEKQKQVSTLPHPSERLSPLPPLVTMHPPNFPTPPSPPHF